MDFISLTNRLWGIATGAPGQANTYPMAINLCGSLARNSEWAAKLSAEAGPFERLVPSIINRNLNALLTANMGLQPSPATPFELGINSTLYEPYCFEILRWLSDETAAGRMDLLTLNDAIDTMTQDYRGIPGNRAIWKPVPPPEAITNTLARKAWGSYIKDTGLTEILNRLYTQTRQELKAMSEEMDRYDDLISSISTVVSWVALKAPVDNFFAKRDELTQAIGEGADCLSRQQALLESLTDKGVDTAEFQAKFDTVKGQMVGLYTNGKDGLDKLGLWDPATPGLGVTGAVMIVVAAAAVVGLGIVAYMVSQWTAPMRAAAQNEADMLKAEQAAIDQQRQTIQEQMAAGILDPEQGNEMLFQLNTREDQIRLQAANARQSAASAMSISLISTPVLIIAGVGLLGFLAWKKGWFRRPTASTPSPGPSSVPAPA
jgi:hypothetical protein